MGYDSVMVNDGSVVVHLPQTDAIASIQGINSVSNPQGCCSSPKALGMNSLAESCSKRLLNFLAE